MWSSYKRYNLYALRDFTHSKVAAKFAYICLSRYPTCLVSLFFSFSVALSFSLGLSMRTAQVNWRNPLSRSPPRPSPFSSSMSPLLPLSETYQVCTMEKCVHFAGSICVCVCFHVEHNAHVNRPSSNARVVASNCSVAARPKVTSRSWHSLDLLVRLPSHVWRKSRMERNMGRGEKRRNNSLSIVPF